MDTGTHTPLINFTWVGSMGVLREGGETERSCSPLKCLPQVFQSEAYWGKATRYLFRVCLFLAQEMTQNFLPALRSLVVCGRRRLWESPGHFDGLCCRSRGLRVRLWVTLQCVSCPAFRQPGTKDLVLQAITYGSGYFLSYKGIFMTSKRGNEKRGGGRHSKKSVWLVFSSKEETKKKGGLYYTDYRKS